MRTIHPYTQPDAAGRLDSAPGDPRRPPRPPPRRPARPPITWAHPEEAHRSQIAETLAETGVFRADEIEVALEVFDAYCDAPGVDYWALGAFCAPNELAGFAFYGPTPCTIGTWDLYWIAVRPGLQGSGIGRGLLERVERHLLSEGARICVIETSSRPDYAATRYFYLACGYREMARVKDFYAEGDDRVIYVKRFAGSLSVRSEK